MLKKILITAQLIIIIAFSNIIFAQNSVPVSRITLSEAQEMAQENYPLTSQYDIIERTKSFSLSNANKAYLPQGTISAQATWQSDVISIPDINLDGLELPGIGNIDLPAIEMPTIDKDQYRIVAELTQLIWDGGRVSAQKKSLEANAEVQKRQIDNQIYALRERVNNIYFGILLMQGQLGSQNILESELQRNYDRVTTYVKNGVANEGDLNVIRVEQLRARQQRIQIESSLEAYLQMLSVLIGESVTTKTEFVKPNVEQEIYNTNALNRPEMAMFDAQLDMAESQRSLLNSTILPTIGAFAQGGYGKPGLNMLQNEFKPFFIGGIRLSWNIGNLYTLKSDKQKIDLQKSSIDAQRQTFVQNINLMIPQQQIEIDKYKKTMKDDDEIIDLQTKILQASEIKVGNGAMTVSDLIKDINALEGAKQAKLLHETQYLMSIYSLKHTVNQE
ncbi:MAG: TolC family protein [Fermentimonas sp.]|jgi:outer membrane protein TolC